MVGVRPLMMWGGQPAQDTVARTSEMETNRERMEQASREWTAAARAARDAREEMERAAARIESWDGEAARAFRASHDEQVRRCARLETTCQAIGETIAGVAASVDETGRAMVAATESAGRTAAALDGMTNPVATGVTANAMPIVVDAWQALSRELEDNCRRMVDDAAARLTHLRR